MIPKTLFTFDGSYVQPNLTPYTDFSIATSVKVYTADPLTAEGTYSVRVEGFYLTTQLSTLTFTLVANTVCPTSVFVQNFDPAV